MSISRPGFTLIELLVVLTVVGVLSTLAIYRYGEVTRSAHIAVMQSDLRALLISEEVHRHRILAYGRLEDLEDWSASPGVAVTLGWLARDGYAATAMHVAVKGVECGLFRGPAPAGAAGPAIEEGVISCQ